MKESKKTLDYSLAQAKLAEKAVETIRALEEDGYNALEVFMIGKDILHAKVVDSPSAKVHED